jgi:CDP-diacylglycerol--glycerol-3-phosphate 3-phosphatidyltransferase
LARVFTTRFQAWVRRRAQRLAALLSQLPITPNQVTVVGTLATVVAAVLAGLDRLLVAGLVLAVSGTFDILDGALARATNRSYPYGAFLDSTMDRLSEGATYLGIAAYFLWHGSGRWTRLEVAACLVALAGSYLVSYVRARAQSLGFRCDGGIFARPERVVVTVAGLIVGSWAPDALGLVVGVLAVATNLTVAQRVWEVWRQARAERRAQKSAAKAPARGETSRP